ncbi:MAG: hypothetical protein RR397_10485 [Odoribacter sp.]
MEESVDQNWFSAENRKKEIEVAKRVLKELKEIEKTFSKTRHKVVERTDFGVRIKYVKYG